MSEDSVIVWGTRCVNVASSNIQCAGWRAYTLVVCFKQGMAYLYPNVDLNEYASLLEARSVGSYFHNRIKGREYVLKGPTDQASRDEAGMTDDELIEVVNRGLEVDEITARTVLAYDDLSLSLDAAKVVPRAVNMGCPVAIEKTDHNFYVVTSGDAVVMRPVLGRALYEVIAKRLRLGASEPPGAIGG